MFDQRWMGSVSEHGAPYVHPQSQLHEWDCLRMWGPSTAAATKHASPRAPQMNPSDVPRASDVVLDTPAAAVVLAMPTAIQFSRLSWSHEGKLFIEITSDGSVSQLTGREWRAATLA